MKILVIGGNGFIGVHVVKRLAQEHRVSVLDKTPNRFYPEFPGVSYLYGDFTDEAFLERSLQGIDVVYHLLSTTVPLSANLNPQFDVSTNLIGSIKLFEKMKDSSVKRIVFASSGGTVYGNPQYIPIDEDHSLKPIGSYGITKVAIEHYLEMFAKQYGLSYLIVRPSNPYGPGQAFSGNQGVISNFLFKILQGEELTVWGDGTAVRDYIYIDDVADFMAQAGTSGQSGIFNLGFGTGTSLNGIIDVIRDVTQQEIQVKHIENNNFNVKEVVLDMNRVWDNFGWKPQVELRAGIREQFDWIKKTR